MPLSWLHRWVRRSIPARRRAVRRPRFVRPALTCLEDRLLLSVSLNLEAPPSSSYGVTNSLVIQYANTGTTAAPAPVLVLSADKANLWLPNDPNASGPSLQMLATNPDPNGPAGTLAPGASGSILVDFTSTVNTASAPINFSLGQLTPGQTIDWSSIEASARPSYMSAAGWNAVFANFTANVGSTTDSYQAALDADATYLAQLGEPTNDVAQLVAYEVNQADNAFGTAQLGDAVDLSVPTPGPDLSFERAFQPTISGRNQTGLAGLGWISNWDISAGSDSQGNVSVNEGGGLRYFTRQSDGSYLAALGDSGVLTALSGGGYRLTESDGSFTTFNANGTLNYVQDANGNRITASYNSSGQMVKLTESDGNALTLAYNSQGFISKITDPSGETASYTYDAAGHLLSVTTAQGTTKYTYVTGTGTPANNALQSILNPDGRQLNYTYDSEGRLTGSFYGTAANPLERVTIGYLSPGGVAYTDANGAKTTVLYTALGLPGLVTDPLGQTARLAYDPSGDLTGEVLPGGTTYSYTYDLKGNLLSETDALGNTTNFTYDAKGNLTSYTDAKGNTTSYAYDSSDDLLSVTYANGAKQSYTYNPLGEATQFTNARGQAIGYSYNAQGQITKETFADGTSYAYTYDAHGNLTSATDAQGRVTKFVYGGDPNNPNDPDLLTEVEYPDGTYLKFSYYAGGDRKQSVDQTGFAVNYTYDATGNLTELTDGKGNAIVKYTYDAAGNLIQQDNGNGTRTVYTYDAAGDVLSITNLAPNHTTINSFDKYTYDALGNVLTDTNQDGQWVYTNDADSQLVHAVFTPNSGDPDKLTAQNIQYAYDAAGNRTAETVNGVTTTYAVNNVNEYTSSSTNGISTTYKYDADGNSIAQTTGGNTTNYTYNELSQLTGISGPGSTASYFYDPLGNRVSQTVNGVTTNFQIDPAGLGNVVAAFGGTGAYNNSGGLLAHYTYGLGLVSQVSAAGAVGYYDFDLTGNTVGITNAAGGYVNKYSYLPFGQTTALAAALPNPFTFVGQFGVMQDVANLFDMEAREYTAATGQFLSNDPIGLGGLDTNLRRYANDNPIVWVDFSGEDPWLVRGGTLPSGPHLATYGDTKHEWPAVQNFWNGLTNKSRYTTTLDYNQIKQAGFDPREVQDHEHLHTVYEDLYGRFVGAGVNGKTEEIWVIQHYLAPKSKYGARHLTPKYQAYQAKKLAQLLSGKYTTYPGGNDSTVTTNVLPGTSTGTLTEGTPATFEVAVVNLGGPITSATTKFNHTQDSSYDVTASNTFWVQNPSGGQYYYVIYATVTFPEEGEYGVTVTVNGNDVVEDPSHEAEIVYDAPMIVNPVNIAVQPGEVYDGPVATFTDLGPQEAESPAYTVSAPFAYTIVPDGGNTFTVYATPPVALTAGTDLYLGVWDEDEYGPNPQGGALIFDRVIGLDPGQPQYSSSVTGVILQANGSQSADPPLAIIDTTDPTITNASQVSVSVGTPPNEDAPIPLVTGITLTRLPGGVTQIVVNGVVSAVQPGAGPTASTPLSITLGNEPPLTAQVEVNETSSDYIVNPVVVNAVAGQSLQNVQVATLAGPANGSYSATINWGDGEKSTGVITALGGGQFSVTGSKPHPYAATGTDTISVTVNGPGSTPAPAAQSLATVVAAPVSPPPAPPPSPPPPSGPPAPPPSLSHPQPSPSHPAAPDVPPLLAFLNQMLGEIETMNSNGTTITDSLLGIQLVVETFGYSGNLESVTLFGINITFLFA